jgi:biopolymer transport protein ExbB
MYYAILEYYHRLMQFMDTGGPVLWFIALLTFVMWSAIFERIWYFHSGLKLDVSRAVSAWEARPEHRSWNASSIRRLLISRIAIKIQQNLSMIKTMVALCPLLGLLGTVTGMIDVFNVLAVTGGGDARAMAGGVSRATIPTMAGMVAALSGVFANTYIERLATTETRLLQDRLTKDPS